MSVTDAAVAVVVTGAAVEVKVVADAVLTTVDVDVVGVTMHEQTLLINGAAKLFSGAGIGLVEVLARFARVAVESWAILIPGAFIIAARSMSLAGALQLGNVIWVVPPPTVWTFVTVAAVLGAVSCAYVASSWDIGIHSCGGGGINKDVSSRGCGDPCRRRCRRVRSWSACARNGRRLCDE